MNAAMPARDETARVFFALWPSTSQAETLHRFALELAEGSGGRAMRAETLHLTLAFIGEVPTSRLANLAEIAANLCIRPFHCRLDRCGYWQDKQLLWAGCQKVDDNLVRLANELTSALRVRGFPVERRPFQAHMTLIRKLRIRPSERPFPPRIDWLCDRFCLVQSELQRGGAAYRTLASWTLAG